MRETRCAVIRFHATMALRARRLSFDSYADEVRVQYQQRTPDDARSITFHAPVREPYAALRANAQIVRRWIEGEVRIPAEVEEALVLALPAEFRTACVAELAKRYNCLAVSIPEDSTVADTRSVTRLMREAGEAIQSTAEFLETFTCPEDPALPRALRELDDVIAAAMAAKAQITLHGSRAVPLRVVAAAGEGG